MVPDPAVEPNGTSRIGSGAGSVQARNEWIHSVHWILVWIGSGGRKRSRAPERGLKVRISEPIPTGRGAVPPSHRYISPIPHAASPRFRPLVELAAGARGDGSIGFASCVTGAELDERKKSWWAAWDIYR